MENDDNLCTWTKRNLMHEIGFQWLLALLHVLQQKNKTFPNKLYLAIVC